MTPLSIHQTSRTFQRGFELCIGNGLTSENGKNNAQIPSVVCLSFAIELALKSILLAEGNQLRGHGLDALFGKLSEPVQRRIIQQVGLCDADFRRELSVVANAFTEWRYLYESPGYHSSILPFLQTIWTSLDTIAAHTARAYFLSSNQLDTNGTAN